MPYFVYQLTLGTNGQVRYLELIDQFAAFKDAKQLARSRRAEATASNVVHRVMFADSEAEAERRLTEVREAPVLKEWEK